MSEQNKIQLFENQPIRTAWNEEQEEWYFSVVDVIHVLTGSENPRRYWSDLKRKLKSEGATQLYENIVQLKMKSSDGKNYKTDAATTEQLLRIIQSIPSPRAEPPNINENSTEFWQKAIYKLYAHNEALLVPLVRGGRLNLVIADSWAKPDYIPTQEKVYKDIQVGDQAYTRTLKESEVLHLTLNSTNAKAVVDGLYESYNNLVQVTMKATIRNSGQHLKVHIDQVNEGRDDFEKNFGEMLNTQYKPFLSSESGILPEFDGYNFEQFGGEGKAQDTRDIRALVDDIFTFTARGLGIPPVLVQGDVAGISDVVTHWLTTCIDPLAAQISEECNRKLYGMSAWKGGDRMTVDTSTIQHFDMLSNAANIEKLIESAYSSINECREATGLEPLPDEWANIHWMTKNISTVDSVARNAANETTKTGGKNSA